MATVSLSVFSFFKTGFQDGEKLVKEIKGSYLFKLKDGEGGATGEFLVDLKNGSGSIKYFEAGQGKGDCQIAVKVSVFFVSFKITALLRIKTLSI